MNKFIRTIFLLILVSFYLIESTFAANSYIESIRRTRKSDGYLFMINFCTKDEWTDGLVFKVFCAFSKGAELSFTSSAHNNVREGWHKTEIRVPKVYRDRYGYIKDYRIEMYHKGVLVSLKGI